MAAFSGAELFAQGGRAYLKARDIFDIYWLMKNGVSPAVPPKSFLARLSIYNDGGVSAWLERARVLLAKCQGYIEAFGGHSDVYANLVVNPSPNHDVMLRFATPRGIIIGVDALRRAGWTTQVQREPDVAVPQSTRFYQTAFFNILPRRSHSMSLARRAGIANPSQGGWDRPCWSQAAVSIQMTSIGRTSPSRGEK
jgi:hypothetical protein